jgi:hypothetical protein
MENLESENLFYFSVLNTLKQYFYFFFYIFIKYREVSLRAWNNKEQQKKSNPDVYYSKSKLMLKLFIFIKRNESLICIYILNFVTLESLFNAFGH